MSSSSDNELPLSAADPRTLEKQPTLPPPPPPPPPLLHPSVVEARPRGMMELRPSISSSQMPRGICSWTIWGSDPSSTRRNTRMPPGANGSGRRVPTWLVGLWSCCKGGWSLSGPCLARPDPSSPRVGQAANHYLLACSGCMRTWASCPQGQEFCIQKPWAQGGMFLAPHSRMRLTLRSLAQAKAPGMQLHLRLHQGHTAAPLLSASHAYMNGPPAKAPSARLLRSAAATSAPSWMRCTSICETLKSSSWSTYGGGCRPSIACSCWGLRTRSGMWWTVT